jgi:hypothetical protein
MFFRPVSAIADPIPQGGDTMAEVLVVVSKVKKMVKEQGLRTGQDYVDALTAKVLSIVNASVEKVKSEGKKKTLGVEDLV